MGITYQLRDLARAREILTVLGRHGFGQLITSLPVDRIPGLGRFASSGQDEPQLPTAERLVQAFAELGPTFVKLGQMLSTRRDLLPSDYIEAFKSLQDSVPPFPSAEARATIEEALGAELDSLFTEFADEPVASASMAQVHRASLAGGQVIAVKVQRPGIEKTLRSDINIMYMLAELVEERLDLGVYTPTAIVEAFDRAISLEVDFHNEASNAELFREALATVEGVSVPRIYRPLSGRRVLTMEWVEGNKLSEIAQTGADPRIVMDRLIEATYEQIFVHSIFHADPHPGNLVVDDDSVLTFLDFGLMGRITPEMRDTLEALFVAVIFKDAEGVARTIYRAGSATGRVNLRELSAEVQELLDTYGDTRLNQQNAAEIATDLLGLARRHQLRLPQEYAILARTEIALDGIARDLVPDLDIMAAVRPYASRLASERLDPERMGSELLRSSVSAATMLRDLPRQVDQVLMDLERGNFQLEARTPDVDRLTDTLDTVGRGLIFAIGVSAFLMSASILVGAMVIDLTGTGGFGFSDLVLGFLVIGSIMGATGLVGALLWNLFVRDRLRAVRWSRFIGMIPGLRRGSKDSASASPPRDSH